MRDELTICFGGRGKRKRDGLLFGGLLPNLEISQEENALVDLVDQL